jgi:valyl-tRNA synthetase
MKSAGLVLKEEPHTLRVPRSQRGGEVIEPLVSEQWFVKMETLAAPGASLAAASASVMPDALSVHQPLLHWRLTS